MQRKRSSDGYVNTVIMIVVVIIIAAIALILVNAHHTKTNTSTQTAGLSSYCVGKTFTAGGSGHCVGDIQTLVNYMENSGLTECPFNNGAQLAVSRTYDSATALQVKSVQGWAECYAKQEGFTSNLEQTGVVNQTTWDELCTYGYTNPSHNGATGATGAITAGKDAGCAQLQ